MYGKSRSADEDSAKKCDHFTKLLDEDGSLNEDNVYIQHGWNWAFVQPETLERKERFVKKYKSWKEWITVELCTNTSGMSKLMPLVINKHENPKTLEHCRSNLPITLISQKNAWLTQILFCDWFQNYFKPTVYEHTN